MPTFFRTDQAAIRFEVVGVSTLDKESWDMFEGADPVAEEVTVFPGGMAPQKALGGIPKWTNATVERLWTEGLAKAYKELAGVCGSAEVRCSYEHYGSTKQPTGLVHTYTGVLTSVERPKYKATESTEAFLKCTFAVDGAVGGN